MRIVSGIYKGRIFNPPDNLPSRPTKDIAKEGLFNILNNRIQLLDLEAIDLFAGTGNISYELASRGAGRVICVEKDHRCVRFIQETIQKLGTEVIQVVKSDVHSFIRGIPRPSDLIFMDPPYALPGQRELVIELIDRGFVKPGGWVVIEHDRGHDFSSIPGYQDTRQYGNSYFSFIEAGNEQP